MVLQKLLTTSQNNYIVLDVTGNASVIIDESTSFGATSTLSVYIMCEVSKEIPHTILRFWT
ncbi:hypothetical protein PR048_004910 [Dryococelus australis]|uniref:Uncharacterized protein n=1 Tax=Dryococelus australis TaxID=614101 RepID=A0ABQ9I7V5_9NEOP|nr:hypothetical protein PR048_004910 [Dryococelus australis]